MSQEEGQRIDELIARVKNLVNFAYFIGAAIFGLGVWVAGQQFTDEYQWKAIESHTEDIKAQGGSVKSAEERLIRIDERTKSTNDQVLEIRQMLKELRK